MRSNVTGPIILIVLGCLLLANNLLPEFELGRVIHHWWPVALIALGISLLFRNK